MMYSHLRQATVVRESALPDSEKDEDILLKIALTRDR
jgi:hypothetical protein